MNGYENTLWEKMLINFTRAFFSMWPAQMPDDSHPSFVFKYIGESAVLVSRTTEFFAIEL